jgi:hypothetical protein
MGRRKTIPWPTTFWRTDVISDDKNITQLHRSIFKSSPKPSTWVQLDTTGDDPIFIGVKTPDMKSKKRVVKTEQGINETISFVPKTASLSTKPIPTVVKTEPGISETISFAPKAASLLTEPIPPTLTSMSFTPTVLSTMIAKQSMLPYHVQTHAVQNTVGISMALLRKMTNTELVELLTQCNAVCYTKAVMGDERFNCFLGET